jgi:hypothetical protein
MLILRQGPLSDQQQPSGEVADSGHSTSLSTGVSQTQATTTFDAGSDWNIHIGAARTVLRKHSR